MGIVRMASATFLASPEHVPRENAEQPREGMNMNTLIKMLKDDSGASAAEYALILAIIGTGIAIAAIVLGGAISEAMNDAADCVNGANSACRP
jgi:pilus assembly protein Flp/PilA